MPLPLPDPAWNPHHDRLRPCTPPPVPPAYPDSPQQHDGKFRNVVPTPATGFLKTCA